MLYIFRVQVISKRSNGKKRVDNIIVKALSKSSAERLTCERLPLYNISKVEQMTVFTMSAPDDEPGVIGRL